MNDDELELWRKVADRTERLDLKTLFTAAIDAPAPTLPALRKAKSALAGQPEARPRTAQTAQVPGMAEPHHHGHVQMDRKAFGKLKRGKLSPEARIDLHGMTLDRAHPALTRFIISSHARGKRLVLVITGKGKLRDEGGPIPVRHGVLRHQVPQWLAMAPLSGLVLQISQAHISHGGGGAYYIYLRRHR